MELEDGLPDLPTDDTDLTPVLQAEQGECLGVIRKSQISVMTRRSASQIT